MVVSTRQGSPATRVTELFGIDYPIVQGGMVWASGWRLAAAVSNAGALGLIGAGSMDSGLLEEHVVKLRAACEKPFGVNIPVSNKRAGDLIDVCLHHKVPIVFTSAGGPGVYTDRLKAAGVKVAHVVSSAQHARKAEAAGCDAVVAEGTEAGGHNGLQEITSMVLWPSVVDAVEIPVIAAGGIADGRGMAAAFALGAQGVQVGTRYALTEESCAHDAYKEAVLRSEQGDIPLYLRSYMPTRAIANEYVKSAIRAERIGATDEELARIRGVGRSRRGIFEGDLEQGELEIGQVGSSVERIISAREVTLEMIAQYKRVIERLSHELTP
jgi:enoyl-[acyl-carrier protein] reductase II